MTESTPLTFSWLVHAFLPSGENLAGPCLTVVEHTSGVADQLPVSATYNCVVTKQQYRLIYALLGTALFIVILLGIAFGSPDGGGSGIPDAIEAVYPPANTQESQFAKIEVDVPVGYAAVLWIDFRGNSDGSPNWFRVPDSEITYVAATGVYEWRPGPDKLLEAWVPGNQRLKVTYETITGLPDNGEYEWNFRVSS
jgi:hypothetical protein